jgi:hypothetical protein
VARSAVYWRTSGPRLLQDADEVVAPERLELHADREAALQLGDEVRHLRDVERAGRDEEHVIGLHHPVLRVDVRALDDREQVALHAAARHVRALPGVAAGDLVDLVDEDDPRVLRAVERLADDPVHVDEPPRLLLREELERLLHLELALALLRAAPEHRDDGVVPELAHHVL